MDAQTTVTIGSGTNAMTTSPIATYWNYTYSQQLYTAAEIAAGGYSDSGKITSISFYLANNPGSESTWNAWQVYLGNTTKNSFSSATDWVPASNLSLVFTGQINLENSLGWVTIPLDIPFKYYPDSNLVVAVRETAPGGAYTGTWRYFTSSARRTLSLSDQDAPPSPASPLAANHPATFNVPQLQFEILPLAVCSGSAPAVISGASAVCPATPFSLSASPYNQVGLSYQFQSSADQATWIDMGLPSLSNMYEAPPQSGVTYYRVQVSCQDTVITSAPIAIQRASCYCIPTTPGGDQYRIEQFSTSGALVNVNRSSGNLSAYENFFGSDSVVVYAGVPVSYSMQVNGSTSCSRVIWVDLNDDDDFDDPGEQVHTRLLPGNNPLTGQFSIPAGTTPGRKRMRVLAFYNPLAQAGTDPCQTWSMGQYEDYAVVVKPAPPPAIASFSPDSGCVVHPVTISGDGFHGVSSVSFGGVPAASYSVLDSNTIQAYPAAGSNGPITVQALGGAATSASGFTYVLPSGPTSAGHTGGTIHAGEPFGLSAIMPGGSVNWYTTSSGGSPFGVATSGNPISRTEYFPGTYTYYAEGYNGIAPFGTMLDAAEHSTAITESGKTIGYAFTPSSDLTVVAVRSYFGTSVSIWTNTGTLIFTQPVSGAQGSWTQTPLSSPITLLAGVTYRIGAFAPNKIYFNQSTPNSFIAGSLGASYQSNGNSFPNQNPLFSRPLVDLAFGSPGCKSSTRTPVSVTIENAAIINIQNGHHCGSGPVTLGATPTPGALVNWYATENGGAPLFTGPTFVTPTLDTTTTYFAEAALPPLERAVGAGAQTSHYDDHLSPFAYLSGNYRHQYLIRASELSAAGIQPGILSALSFHLLGSGPLRNNFSISLKQTDSTALSSAWEEGATLVFSGNYTPVSGKNTFTFSNPFIWDGLSSIVVQTCYNNNNAGNQVSSSRTVYDGVGYHATHVLALNGSESGICENADAGSLIQSRPKITFVQQAAPGSRVPATAAILAPVALSSDPACIGKPFSISAEAPGAAAFQWYKDGAPIMNATAAAYTVGNLGPTDNGTYSVTITGGSFQGCTTSAPVVVVAQPNPTPGAAIATDTVLCAGESTTLYLPVDVGSGTDFVYWAGLSPYSQYQDGQRTQYLIRADELLAAGLRTGNLTSLAWNVPYVFSIQPFASYTIKMMHTTAANLNADAVGAATTVYENPLLPIPVEGWNTYWFSTPFAWDGVSNIVVQVCFQNDPFGEHPSYYSDNSIVYGTPTSYTSVRGYSGDNVPSCFEGGVLIFDNVRPNFRFTGEATVSWSDGSSPSGSGSPITVLSAATTTYTPTLTNAGGCSAAGTGVHVMVEDPVLSLALATPDMACGDAAIPLQIQTSGTASPALVWNTMQGLYTDQAATLPYTGGMAATLFAKPSGTIQYSATLSSILCAGSGNQDSVALSVSTGTSGVASTSTTGNAQAFINAQSVDIRDTDCGIIATVSATGSMPVAGMVNARIDLLPGAALNAYGEPYAGRITQVTPEDESSSATATITLYATQAELNSYNAILPATANPSVWSLAPITPGDPNALNIRVTQIHGPGQTGAVELLEPAMVVWDATLEAWAITVSVTGFSTFYIHTLNATGTPLPVVLVDVLAANEGKRNKITWQSASEDHLKSYVVERSIDGKLFTQLAEVTAKGNGAGYITYDQAPNAGLTYYRLKMVDEDGTIAYSKTVSAFMNARDAFALQAAPNPTTGLLTITALGGVSTAKVQITDVAGHLVAEVAMTDGRAEVDLSSVAAGVYFVKYTDLGRTEVIQIVKQ